ncbi:MAG: potassium channel family protein, partial [Gemmatimonadota bacterium]|nr:potassium channel family protein [Gemmatimonadota bacterium]
MAAAERAPTPRTEGDAGVGGLRSQIRRRFVGVLAFGAFLVLAGTAAFLTQPGWTFSDAIWMAVITITAVGYGEVRELSDAGRIIASAVLVGGVTWMGLWFALITSAIVELDLARAFRKRRIMKQIERLKNHVIVCGAGRTGRQVIRELIEAGSPHLVLERSGETAEALRAEFPDTPVLEGDATKDEALVAARIGTARGLVACLSQDTDNLFVCL